MWNVDLRSKRPEIFLLVDLRDFFSDLGSEGRKKKSSENDQLTGHFQSLFFLSFFYFHENSVGGFVNQLIKKFWPKESLQTFILMVKDWNNSSFLRWLHMKQRFMVTNSIPVKYYQIQEVDQWALKLKFCIKVMSTFSLYVEMSWSLKRIGKMWNFHVNAV